MERVLVYARHDQLGKALERARGDHPDAELLPRNASAYTEGQTEAADRVLVDNRYPEIADDYRDAEPAVDLFSWDGRGEEEADVPDEEEVPEPFREQFASQTAYEEAEGAGLEPPDLEGVEPAGKTGYTTAQIRDLADEQ